MTEASEEIQEHQDEEAFLNFSIVQRTLGKKNINRVARRILVVEDDQINILVLSNYLKSFEKISFQTAFNGKQAIELIKNQANLGNFFDLILMDCMMPIMDGFEATRIIRKMIDSGEIPNLIIIACTANASPKDQDICIKNGMIDSILKPVCKNDLRIKLKKYMGIDQGF